MILDSDERLDESLPKEGEPQACGCEWKRTRTKHGAPGKVELTRVCVLHRRWLTAIMSRMRTAPAFNASVKLVGPAYQQATRHGGGGRVPERVDHATVPAQPGGVMQMVGPLFQSSRSALVEEAPKLHHEDPEPTVADILGFDPSKVEGA